MVFLLKKHVDASKRLFLVVVDSELKGRCLENDKVVIDLNSSYYCGDECEESVVINLLNKAFNIVFVGNDSVDLGLKQGFIKDFLKINEIKYAFFVR